MPSTQENNMPTSSYIQAMNQYQQMITNLTACNIPITEDIRAKAFFTFLSPVMNMSFGNIPTGVTNSQQSANIGLFNQINDSATNVACFNQ
jgi:hypothetical protein